MRNHSIYLEEELAWAGSKGGHAALEHAPAAGLGHDGAATDVRAVGGLEDRLHHRRAGRNLQPCCSWSHIYTGTHEQQENTAYHKITSK